MSNWLLFAFFCILKITPGQSDGYLMATFYTIQTNSSNDCKPVQKNVDMMSRNISTSGITNSSIMTLHFMMLGQSATVQITGRPIGFYVDVNASVNNIHQGQNFSIVKSDELSKSYKHEPIRMISVKSSQFSTSGNYTKACFDVAVVYNATQKSFNTTGVSIGCWSWSHNGTHYLNHTDFKSDLRSWVERLAEKACSGSLSSVQVTPALALVLAILITIINK